VRAFVLSSLLMIAASARAQTLLRMATPAPDGTAWARAIHRFALWVEDETGGTLKVKIYYGGIAGDELQMAARIKKDQLDGAFSGGMLCMKLAPSLRVMRVLGLFQSRNELRYVLGKLKPETDAELRHVGLELLGTTRIGPDLIFARQKITTMGQLKSTRLWIWDVDETLEPGLRYAGFSLVPAPLEAASKLYDAGEVDGFVAAPSSALAFQWSAQARFLLPLRLSTLDACVLVSHRFLDAQPVETQRVIRDAAARAVTLLDDAQQLQDEALLNGLFQKQGLRVLPIPDELRARFFVESRQAREALPSTVISKELMDRVMSMLADYRAEHHGAPGGL
jgi:TRAP-type C4-dicarboxylate transport system substrate-binding protein